MSIIEIVETNTIKLPADVHLPDGTPARIMVEIPGGQTLAERSAGLIGLTD